MPQAKGLGSRTRGDGEYLQKQIVQISISQILEAKIKYQLLAMPGKKSIKIINQITENITFPTKVAAHQFEATATVCV